MTTKKKHTRHKFTNLLEWINPPWREDDNQSHRRFSVKARCACGEIGIELLQIILIIFRII